MRSHILAVFGILVAQLAWTPAADAAPIGTQICQKMIADGRNGGMSQKTCLCNHRVADAVLDDDIKALLLDSWYTGTDNTKALERLPKRRRVKNQLIMLRTTINKDCL